MSISTALIIPSKPEQGSIESPPISTPNVTDESRLAIRIERALRTSSFGALRSVVVYVDSRTIRLMGNVPTYHLKQIAQEMALSHSRIHRIHNDLNVAQGDHDHLERSYS